MRVDAQESRQRIMVAAVETFMVRDVHARWRPYPTEPVWESPLFTDTSRHASTLSMR